MDMEIYPTQGNITDMYNRNNKKDPEFFNGETDVRLV